MTRTAAWQRIPQLLPSRAPAPRPLGERHQLCGSAPGLRASQAPRVLDGAWRAVLLQIGAVDRVFQALAPGAHGAHGDFAIGNLDRAVRLLEERPIPASRLQAPGTHENAAL